MAYKEYTKCASVEAAKSHSKEGLLPWGSMIETGYVTILLNGVAILLVASILEATEISIVAGPLAISLLVGVLAALVAYCDWWLKYRLICLDDDNDHCVVGFVAEVEPPWEKTNFPGNLDTDFTMNIGILGTWFGGVGVNNLESVSLTQPFGYLLKGSENDLLLQHGFPLTGMTPEDLTDGPYDGQPPMQVLHVEFEGGGVSTFRDWLVGLILLLLVAEALSAACAAGLLWACAILIILAAWLPFLGAAAITHALSKQANPADIDKALATLSVGDVVLVSGRWVYDAGHIDEGKGWNEIHPIRHCQILYEGVLQDWGGFPVKYDQWCHLVATTGSALVKTEQQKPENNWEIHPLVDGCVKAYQPPWPTIGSVTNVASYNNCYNGYTVAASATDPSGIAKLELWYKFPSGVWQNVPMVLNPANGLYEAVIPNTGTVTYYVRAYSVAGNTADSAQYSTYLYCVT